MKFTSCEIPNFPTQPFPVMGVNDFEIYTPVSRTGER
jgi:hypothetical protein